MPHLNGPAESPVESRMRWRFVDGGLPAPDVQVGVLGDGRSWYLDTGWREQRVAAEFDGHEAHMTPEQLRDDWRRHDWLTEHRWTLLHVTAADVHREHRRMVAEVARALGLPLQR